jgi:hypothetical protein
VRTERCDLTKPQDLVGVENVNLRSKLFPGGDPLEDRPQRVVWKMNLYMAGLVEVCIDPRRVRRLGAVWVFAGIPFQNV